MHASDIFLFLVKEAFKNLLSNKAIKEIKNVLFISALTWFVRKINVHIHVFYFIRNFFLAQY